MRKVPTLFMRDLDDMRHVTREVNPAAAWVLDGEGVATRKYDGTCVMLDEHGQWWARREVKQGKSYPPGYREEETDPNTGKTVGWEPMAQSPFAKAFRTVEAVPTNPGTYELCGPKVNGNPERLVHHLLIPHGQFRLDLGGELGYDALATWLAAHDYEGIVWHRGNGDMVKIKRKDFPSRPSRQVDPARS
jgi:hypothetical protein